MQTTQEIVYEVLLGGLGAAIVVGLLIGLVTFATAVIQSFTSEENLISPTAFRLERTEAKPIAVGQFAPDEAWPGYLVRQVRADVQKVGTEWQRLYAGLWRWPIAAFFEGSYGVPLAWWVFFPIPVLTISTLLAAGVLLILAYMLFVLVVVLVLVVCGVTYCGGVAALRSIDAGWARLRGAEASCPRCYLVTPRPAYLCPGCSALHRDVRSGRLGLIARRCECGELMPTTVLRAAWRLVAVCQRCEEPLLEGAAVARDVRIPIFGETLAGKTRLAYAALDSLTATAQTNDIQLSFPDDASLEKAEQGLEVIRRSRNTSKTSEDLPRAFSCRLGSGATSTLMHIFDAAGESFRSATSHDEMGFLRTGHGLIYVIDPFALGPVRDQMTGSRASALALASASRGDPEAAYGEVMTRLRGSGVKSKSQRLAIVVSKVDILEGCGLAPSPASEAIAKWLYDLGLHNLVLAAKREFAEVRYFAVASLSVQETTPENDPGAPFRWLLRSRGVRLPADPVLVSSSSASSGTGGDPV